MAGTVNGEPLHPESASSSDPMEIALSEREKQMAASTPEHRKRDRVLHPHRKQAGPPRIHIQVSNHISVVEFCNYAAIYWWDVKFS